MTPREHAITASQLLTNVADANERMEEHLSDPSRHPEAVATGAVRQHNAQVDFTLKVALAHALAALALAATEEAG